MCGHGIGYYDQRGWFFSTVNVAALCSCVVASDSAANFTQALPLGMVGNRCTDHAGNIVAVATANVAGCGWPVRSGL